MSGSQQLLLAAVQQAVSDPNFEYTTLLLPGNGTNGAQNNTFLDSSTNAFSITRNGNTTQGTFSPFSQTGWSAYFDGTGDSLTTPSITIGSGDFTIEGWQYMLPNGANYGRLVGVGDFFNSSGFAINFNPSTSKFEIGNANSNFIISSGTFSFNTWYHIAVVRSGSTVTLYVNGTSQGSATNTNSISGVVYISAVNYLSTIYYALSYTSNVRITTSAVYTTNFTPPTAPLTAISNTQLLTCQSNRFIDNSTNAYAITRNGDVSVQAFSPFNPTAAWSAATNGGSGYFDGSGDSLTLASNAAFAPGTGDFTVEAWIYPTAAWGTWDGVFVVDVSGGIFFGKLDTGFGLRAFAVANIVSTTAPDINTWTHVAVSRSGTTVRLFINGALAASATSSQNFGQGTAYIGNSPSAGEDFSGYISGLRLVKGTAVYTAAFTPPTAPLTAITNTSLLCNFTNAGIYDATSKNDLETVGNAQISTTQSKFGGSSMYFDGTGDYLKIPSQSITQLGAGDWTIEFWLYASSLLASVVIFEQRSTTTQVAPIIYIGGVSNNEIKFYVNGADRIVSSAISAATWYHVALAKYNGNTKLFINGSQSGSTYVDANTYVNNPIYIGSKFDATAGFPGYINDLRVTRGIARYTSNFTPPTTAFPVL